jgi:hypothetical protein
MPDPTPPAEFDAFAANYDEALQRGLDLTGETRGYFAEGRVSWLPRMRCAAEEALARVMIAVHVRV